MQVAGRWVAVRGKGRRVGELERLASLHGGVKAEEECAVLAVKVQKL